MTIQITTHSMPGIPVAAAMFAASVVWLLVAFWPFSRLVHAWSIPVDYPRRSPILYRRRGGRTRRPRPADGVTVAEGVRR